jgi:hypothetical protein
MHIIIQTLSDKTKHLKNKMHIIIQTLSSNQRLPMSPRLCGNLEGECRTVAKESSLFAL